MTRAYCLAIVEHEDGTKDAFSLTLEPGYNLLNLQHLPNARITELRMYPTKTETIHLANAKNRVYRNNGVYAPAVHDAQRRALGF